MFAGTTSGGFFRSTNQGSSWKEANKGLDRHSITSISSSNDFRSDRTLFAGGGQGGVFRSTDGGDNWVEIGSGLTIASVAALGVLEQLRLRRHVVDWNPERCAEVGGSRRDMVEYQLELAQP